METSSGSHFASWWILHPQVAMLHPQPEDGPTFHLETNDQVKSDMTWLEKRRKIEETDTVN